MPGPGMLVLADRNFLSWSLARAVLATGAHVLWRASASFALRPVRALPDGTYLAELKPPRKSAGPAVTVRVIECTVHTTPEDGGEETSELFCLVTDLLDTEEYQALDLACCYPERWGCETVIGGTRPTWARASPSCAARTRGHSPGNVGTVRRLPGNMQAHRHRGERRGHPAGKDQLPARPGRRDGHRHGFPPDQADLALASFLLKILRPGFSVRDRPDRASPRKTRKADDYPARKPGERSVTGVTRRIQFHLLCSWQVT